MDKLLIYINSLPRDQRQEFACSCGTSLGYLRKAISIRQLLSEKLAVAIERETGGAVTVADLRPEFAETLKAAGYVRIQPKDQAA